MSDKELRFKLNAPLNEGDNEDQTYGCRANNPDICRNCYVESVCAFVTEDHICSKPSAKWNKYYKELREGAKK